MTTRTRLLLHAVAAMLLACVGVTTLPTPPAGATITRLCTGYTSCANAGMSHAGYAQASGTMYWRMYSGHNCTNYAAYRMIKNGMPNVRPWEGGGNATYWGTSMPHITDTVPTVGSIAWWRAGVYPAGSAGHVAYVEKVVSSSEIIVSQDSWGGDFSWARITRTSGWPSGFIHFNDVALTNTKAPALSGEVRVGSTLTATSGTWNPKDVDLLYTWRSGGQDLKVGSESTFTLTKALAGKRVRVKVTATKLGYPTASARSPLTAPVAAGEMTNTTAPTVTGTPEVGQTLTAGGDRWSPGAESRAYQWRADGTPLDGAVAKTLTVTPDLVGKALSVTVSASRAGFETVSATSARTAPVPPSTLTATEEPTVTGALRLGETLEVAPGGATPQATRSVQWLRGGTPIDGATRLRYQLTPDDLGQSVTAQVTWSRTGYRSLALAAPDRGTVRTVPTLTPTVEGRTGGFVVTATVTAPGLTVVPGVLQVVRAGNVMAERPIRADGTVRLVLRDLRAGERNYRFKVPVSAATTKAVVVQRVTVG